MIFVNKYIVDRYVWFTLGPCDRGAKGMLLCYYITVGNSSTFDRFQGANMQQLKATG